MSNHHTLLLEINYENIFTSKLMAGFNSVSDLKYFKTIQRVIVNIEPNNVPEIYAFGKRYIISFSEFGKRYVQFGKLIIIYFSLQDCKPGVLKTFFTAFWFYQFFICFLIICFFRILFFNYICFFEYYIIILYYEINNSIFYVLFCLKFIIN